MSNSGLKVVGKRGKQQNTRTNKNTEESKSGNQDRDTFKVFLEEERQQEQPMKDQHEPGTSNAFNWNDEEEETTASRNITVDDLQKQRQQLLREQDKGLDILGEIISKQKYMAKGISTEIDAQNEILDDIHGAMDQTTDRLIRNTRNIKKVDRKSDSCCYWIIIILLLVAIVVVICV